MQLTYSDLIIDLNCQILIYTICQAVINSEKAVIYKHFKSMHLTSVLHSELTFWYFIINCAQLIDLSMYKNIQAAETLSWYSALKVIYEDYHCAIFECSYCAL